MSQEAIRLTQASVRCLDQLQCHRDRLAHVGCFAENLVAEMAIAREQFGMAAVWHNRLSAQAGAQPVSQPPKPRESLSVMGCNVSLEHWFPRACKKTAGTSRGTCLGRLARPAVGTGAPRARPERLECSKQDPGLRRVMTVALQLDDNLDLTSNMSVTCLSAASARAECSSVLARSEGLISGLGGVVRQAPSA